MIVVLAAQIVVGATGTPADCLRPLTKEEEKQDDASNVSKRRAGNIVVLEPDSDQLPDHIPAQFEPQLVRFSYLVGTDGRVSDCGIDKGSSISEFNAPSCELLRKHYRTTAGPQSGKRQKAAVNWTPRAVLPQRRLCNNNGGTLPVSSERWINNTVFQGTRIQAGSALMALDIAVTGQVEKCTIKAATVDRILQRNLCTMAVQRAVALPAVDETGKPFVATLSFVVRFNVAR
jgi:hypothetical protein